MVARELRAAAMHLREAAGRQVNFWGIAHRGLPGGRPRQHPGPRGGGAHPHPVPAAGGPMDGGAVEREPPPGLAPLAL